MAVTWTINGVSPESLGLTLAGGSFRTQGVSFCAFNADVALDGAEVFANGAAVTLARVQDAVSVPFFQGKIRRIRKTGNPDYEGHDYALEDAWSELEETIYQEEWFLGSSSFMVPKAVLGIALNALGTAYERCTVGGQIRELIRFAIDEAGISIVMGDCPDGEMLWPEQVENMSIAEIIRKLLKFHPDWIPWIDHTTATPTFNVTPVNTSGAVTGLSTLSLDVSGAGDAEIVQLSRRDDMLPDGVRIFYEFATTIDSDVFRNGVIDKYPLAVAEVGPKILNSTIQLAGLSMQTQQSAIQVRAIPTDHTDAGVKAYLKEKFPHLADIPDAAFTVTKFERALVGESAAHPDPINPRATRLSVANVNDLPNELLRGQINDWMRVKVGKVGIQIQLARAGDWSAATAAQIKAFGKGVLDIASMTATNATTKNYQGISQWAAPEEVPTGIAQAIYTAIHAACAFEGSVTLMEDEISATRRYGKKLNLTGAAAAWATMNAPIHSVDWEVGSGRTTIGFGPVPELSPQDFLELQRMIRQRPTRWWSVQERESNKLGSDKNSGADNAPSAGGDTVGGYDQPETLFAPPAERSGPPFSLRTLRITGGKGYVIVWPGYIREVITAGTVGADAVAFHMPEVDAIKINVDPPVEFEMNFDQCLFVTFSTDKKGNVKATPPPGMLVAASTEKSTHYQPADGEGAGGSDGTYKIKIGQLIGTGAADARWIPFHNSDIEHYHELWTGENIGGGASLYKGRKADDDVYEFRTPIAAGGQIQVDVAGDNVEIHGNGFTDDIEISIDGGTPQALASVADGFVTAVYPVDIPLPEGFPGGGNLNLHIRQFQEDSDGIISETTDGERVLVWRNGLYIAAYNEGATLPTYTGTLDDEDVHHFAGHIP